MSNKSRGTALIVDDEALLCLDLASMVEGCGLDTFEAYDAASAMRWLEGNVPELAVLDYQLQNGGIIPLAKMLARSDVPIIVCSGYSKPHDLHETLVGAPWIVKPVIDAELKIHVTTLMTVRRLRTQS